MPVESLISMPKILREYWIRVKEYNNDSFTLYMETAWEYSSMYPLTGFGHCKGSFSFLRGTGLPNVSNGNYDFTVNGNFYGELLVCEDGVGLVLLEDVIFKPPIDFPGSCPGGESIGDDLTGPGWIKEQSLE